MKNLPQFAKLIPLLDSDQEGERNSALAKLVELREKNAWPKLAELLEARQNLVPLDQFQTLEADLAGWQSACATLTEQNATLLAACERLRRGASILAAIGAVFRFVWRCIAGIPAFLVGCFFVLLAAYWVISDLISDAWDFLGEVWDAVLTVVIILGMVAVLGGLGYGAYCAWTYWHKPAPALVARRVDPVPPRATAPPAIDPAPRPPVVGNAPAPAKPAPKAPPKPRKPARKEG